MINPMTTSPFIDTAAVEAWDAWFRWRERGKLHDMTVDATWHRVASALVGVEPPERRMRARQLLFDAFSSWRLLLDERILTGAGTSSMPWPGGDPVAVLNVACFVRAPHARQASIDLVAVEEVAILAARALESAMVLLGYASWSGRLRIGMIGMGDALRLLGMDYGCAAARVEAERVALAVAHGATEGSMLLARERGPRLACQREWIDRARARGYSPALITHAGRVGLRHTALTAISSQPKLALFANGASDALEPALSHPVAHVINDDEAPRVVYSAGYAHNVATRLRKTYEMADDPTESVRQAMYDAVQPWMDEALPHRTRTPAAG